MPSSPWLLRPSADERFKLRLFCFPYAGGGASVYVPWARLLSPTVQLCAVQFPGRETRLRERPYMDLEGLLDGASEAIRPYLDTPFALYGHSMGALIAFELARRLRREGAPAPRRLIVSGHRAPHLPNSHPPIAHLPDLDFLAELRQRYEGIPEEVLRHTNLIALLLPSLRADMALIERYAYVAAQPLECSISAYGGLQDRVATEAELAAWQTQTQGLFSLNLFSGNHFFIRSAATAVVTTLSRELAEMGQSPAGASTA